MSGFSLGSSYLELSGLPGTGCLFPRVTFSNKLSASFCLLLRPLFLFYLMLSYGSLKQSSFFENLFFFLLLCLLCVPLLCLLAHWSILLFHPVGCWTWLLYFLVQLLYSSALWPLFGTFCIFYLFGKALTVFIYFPPKFGEDLCDHCFEFFIR